MKIHLIQVDHNRINGLPQLAPEDQRDMPMFMHCTGGAIAVTVPAFFDLHLPVFKAHGVEITLNSDFVMSKELLA